MKKVLLVTTVSGFVPQFEMNNVRLLQDMGYEVHYATNLKTPSYGTDNSRLEGTGIICHQIDFERSPYTLKNLQVYRQLKLLMEKNNFSLVHCHTPMGGAMARLAAHMTHTKPVIYTAHGFHFYKGAPFKNWLIYFSMERFFSRWTDVQICINQEDYQRAVKYFHAKKVVYLSGVGIPLAQFENRFSSQNGEQREEQELREQIQKDKKELSIPDNKTILLSVGELIPRKNHALLLRALAKTKNRDFVYLICGHGELEGELKALTQKLHLEKQVFFMGYQTDIAKFYRMADAFLFPSLQEGLPMAMMEAMAAGLPILASDIRGNHDLLAHDTAALLSSKKEEAWTAALDKWMMHFDVLRKRQNNRQHIEPYDSHFVTEKMAHIYKEVLRIN